MLNYEQMIAELTKGADDALKQAQKYLKDRSYRLAASQAELAQGFCKGIVRQAMDQQITDSRGNS